MGREGIIRVAATSDHPRILAAYNAWGYGHGLSPSDTIYMLEFGSELAGLVRRTYEHGVTMLRGMFVAPDRQRQGNGMRLLQAFVRELNGVECYCLPYTHVAGFYGKVGFVPVPEHTIAAFLQERLVEYRGRGLSVLAMRRPAEASRYAHAG